MDVRQATEDDFNKITEILNHYIMNSDARYFEPEPVSLESRKLWLHSFNIETPHKMFVAVEKNEILGFCCSQKYRPEIAYNKTVEVSVYISPRHSSTGVGTALYQKLFSSLTAHELHRAVAGIALPNAASLALHKKFNFNEVGTFNEYGIKNGKYISSTWLQKNL